LEINAFDMGEIIGKYDMTFLLVKSATYLVIKTP
jgi:hypothetical protein